MSDPLAPFPCPCGRQDTVLVAFKRNSSLLVRRFRDMGHWHADVLRCVDCIADMAAEVATFAWPNEPDYTPPTATLDGGAS